MNISSSSSHKRKIVISITALLLILIAIFALEKTRVTDFIKDPTYSEPIRTGPTDEDLELKNQTQAEQKSDFLDNSAEDNSVPAVIPTESNTITLNPEQSGATVIIRNELHGQGYSTGSCKLTVQNGTSSTTQDAQIIYQPEYSMCAGFSIPVSSVGTGNWTIRLDVTPFDGATLTKTTALEVKS